LRKPNDEDIDPDYNLLQPTTYKENQASYVHHKGCSDKLDKINDDGRIDKNKDKQGHTHADNGWK